MKVIIFAVDLEMADVKKLFEKGIKAYVGKNASSAELKEAFTEVLSGKIYITDEVKNRLVHFVCEVEDAEIRVHQLNIEITRCEREVLKLVCQGFRTKKIADQLGISPHTVECHRWNIMHKFNIRSSANLVKFARENNLTES
ncbi:DNA-binding response regulator [Kaistella daneshvariae]|uniref:DNA-binding response regulator n=1 Tax=Kaistella daneshvariae TaxID=2487074 RepID=A0ABM7CAL6_9FLAO|nr:response regulator transcription factor [Kaistella daneshvariae]AZI68043.1 DNA-binding response regulator [Kaistella daneshvariae]